MRALVVLAALTLLIPATALAATLRFKSDLVVPNASAAGIALNASPGAAERALPRAGRHCTSIECSLDVGKGLFEVMFAPTPVSSGSVVIELSINAPGSIGAGPVSFNTPLAKLKTAKGIGIGSTYAAVKRAYPAAKRDGGSLLLTARNGSSTLFDFYRGRVSDYGIDSQYAG